MKSNKGITIIKLTILIILIIMLVAIILTYFQGIPQKIDIAYKTVTKKIDISKEIEENEKLMGATDVKGEGITINILDGNDLIHQEDLIILIDELKNSGSQAISINDQRIINSTYIFCDGSVILIDGVKIGNPFTIKAIGNSETIYGALTRNKGYVETLEKAGIDIKIEKNDEITILKTNKDISSNYSVDANKIERLYKSNKIVGKSTANGKGLEIVIEENESKLSALSFLQIVNDLNSAGAEAISINGQRITNMTDMMDISGTYILINSSPIKAPYIIDVIGNQEKIESTLNYNNSYITKIKSKGNNVDIYRIRNVKIDEYVQKRDQNKMLTDYLNV